ncbi:MAG: hypothetical protein B6U95_02985 [Thermofilum sp. ex4484_82]|nr:MAG: hypothetical protein B6U95_02985 [Thermofilum sp. ex4484_82]OYT39003.1 MAG: hypothetical protein B6U96_02980 [Archaeoglobales archaeon ex4484_92]RLE76968.1 MAG: hypothetical protein DRZ80_00045 [Thermoprotei archaeon]
MTYRYLKPRYRVEINGETFEPLDSSEILRIEVSKSLGNQAGTFSIRMAKSPRAESIRLGETVVIHLGYGDNLQKVFTGWIKRIEPEVESVVFSGYDAAIKLIRLYIDQFYENQNAGGIVKELARKAGVEIEEAEDGMFFPCYTIYRGKSAYTHIEDLALKCGFYFYINEDNKLFFGKKREISHKLKYGRDIVSFEVYKITPVYKGVILIKESPASIKGRETSHWICAEPYKAIKGEEKYYLVYDPTIKERDAADRAAESILNFLTKNLKGKISVIGNPKIKPAHQLEIEDVPYGEVNGKSQVLRVNHVFSLSSGFTTNIYWWR